MSEEDNLNNNLDWKFNTISVRNLIFSFLFLSICVFLIMYYINSDMFENAPLWFFISWIIVAQTSNFFISLVIISGTWPLYYTIQDNKIFFKPQFEIDSPIIRTGMFLFKDINKIVIEKQKDLVTFHIQDEKEVIFCLDGNELSNLEKFILN